MDGKLLFQGILLDMDGVLLDTERLAYRCWSVAEKETGVHMPEGFYFSLIGQSLPLIEQRLRGVLSSVTAVKVLLEAARLQYHRALEEEEICAKPGAVELLRFLSEEGIPVCLATSTYASLAETKLRAAGLDGWLPRRVCGDEVERSKPAPDIYLAAAGQLSLTPSVLLAVEDSGNGLRSALEAGCRVLHVPDIAPVPLELQARIERVYGGLDALREALQRGELFFHRPS